MNHICSELILFMGAKSRNHYSGKKRRDREKKPTEIIIFIVPKNEYDRQLLVKDQSPSWMNPALRYPSFDSAFFSNPKEKD